MPKIPWVWAAAACLCAAATATGKASAPTAGARFTVIDKSQGLPRSSVFAMAQTRDGYLWLGTGRGLARYDGMQFTLFNENNTPGLTGQRFVRIFEDSHTNLWLGSESAGVFLVRDGQITNLDIGRGRDAGHLVAACEDGSGAMWLSTADGQLYRFFNGKVEPISARQCHALMAEDTGLIWIGVGTAGNDTLYALGPFAGVATAGFPVACQVPLGKLDFLLASRQGGYWRMANGRIQKWHRDHLERDIGPYPWNPVHAVSAACEDRQGNLVVGTYGDGVYWFDAQGKATHLSSDPSELGTSFIFSLVMDHDGCLWVGTDGRGLKCVRPQVFEVLEKSREFSINSVCGDGQGGLWFAVNNGGVSFWKDNQVKEFKRAEGLEDLYVQTVFADQESHVWAGTHNRGLFELRDGRFVPDSGLTNLSVTALYRDHRGTLWAGTSTGLARRTDQGWTVLTRADGLSDNAVQALAEDAAGNLWVGTRAGLNCLESGRCAVFGHTNGLPSNDVTSLFEDGDGGLWIGTQGGLARFKAGQFKSFGASPELAGEAIDYVIEDEQGFLWIAATPGLFRASKSELDAYADGSAPDFTLRPYGEKDGFLTTEYSAGAQPAAWRAPGGRLWFPTTRGLVSLDPAHLLRNTNPPPVVIESVRVQDQLQTTNRFPLIPPPDVTLGPGKQRLEIHYASLNLAAADRARFRYKMEGYAADWRLAGAERVAYYDKLPPDYYRFRVQACNEDEVWNEVGCSLGVVVLPPFWRTWWFVSWAVASILGLVAGTVHYASTQRLQRQLATLRQQEALEAERARIARDLHDQLGANLTQVALLGEMAETDREQPEEVAAHARQISQTARETTNALDEIVWTVNPSNDTLDGLVNYICKYAQDYFALAGLRYRLDAPAQLPAAPISPEFRHNVFLVAKEAVNNIVKHAGASSAWLRLRLEPHRFVLELEDDGRGLDPKAHEKGRNGLRNMRKRMLDIGGDFELAPAPTRGTIVRLSAPLSKSVNLS